MALRRSSATGSELPLPHRPGALGRIRTCDARFRKPTLYPLSYEGRPAGHLPPPVGHRTDGHAPDGWSVGHPSHDRLVGERRELGRVEGDDEVGLGLDDHPMRRVEELGERLAVLVLRLAIDA